MQAYSMILEVLAGKFASQGFKDAGIGLLPGMLVRSYDPYISCSVR